MLAHMAMFYREMDLCKPGLLFLISYRKRGKINIVLTKSRSVNLKKLLQVESNCISAA